MMRRDPAFRKQARVHPPSAHAKINDGAAGLPLGSAVGFNPTIKGRREPIWEASMLLLRFVTATFGLLVCGAAFADDPLPRAKPEEVGLSSERLARISAVLKADIEAGRIPGAVIAIARRGKLVALDAYGWRDKAAGSSHGPVPAAPTGGSIRRKSLRWSISRRRPARSAGTTGRRSTRWCIRRSSNDARNFGRTLSHSVASWFETPRFAMLLAMRA
jgi:hypothetical protein